MTRSRAMYFVGVLLVVLLVSQSGCGSGQAAADKAMMETTPEATQLEVQTPAEQAIEGIPSITVENPVHDFGQMGPSARDKCAFKFKNSGTALLMIDRVQSTCGCTIPELDKKEYAPGEEGVVNVTFTAPAAKTQATKHIYIVSNDPKTPRAELTIKAEVVVKVEVSPETIELRLDQDNAGMPNLVVKSLDDEAFSIQSVNAVPQNTVSIPFDRTQKATAFTLTPRVDMEALKQTLNGVIQIRSDHPQSGILMVRYQTLSEITIARPNYVLQDITPGAAVINDNLIRSNYDKDLEFASAESQNGYMEIESHEKDGKHLRLQIKITSPEQSGSSITFKDRLKITLQDGTVASIQCIGLYKRT